MRRFLAILLCKIAYVFGQAVGRGTALPGKIALKICPNILTKLNYHGKIIAVSGSNAKSTTTDMIAHTLRYMGHSVIMTQESNQLLGIVTAILKSATLTGAVKADYIVLESEERHAKFMYKDFRPDYFLVTNLVRDQLSRNGNQEFIGDCLEEALRADTKLILNADDPYIKRFASICKDCVTFGLDCADLMGGAVGVYDDGALCPSCFADMEYSGRAYAHFGNYACTQCDFMRGELNHAVTAFDGEAKIITVDSQHEISIEPCNAMTAYNKLAAYSAVVTMGLPAQDVAKALSNYSHNIGRIKEMSVAGLPATLLASKHESSISYNLSIEHIANASEENVAVVFIFDTLSRKYFAADTSWLWDIDFARLNQAHIKQIIVTGYLADSLMQRLSYENFDHAKILCVPIVEQAAERIDKELVTRVFLPAEERDSNRLM